MDDYQSWGRYPQVTQSVLGFNWRGDKLPTLSGKSILAQGFCRSYGDSCLNENNVVLSTRALDRMIAFDPASGVLRCESGVSLEQILNLAVPQGWFLPVTPGTKFVSVGGAIANDVHGKNHHRAGTFGRHVRAFELLRSDGSRRVCSERSDGGLYAATIGGLGLTGVITWAEIQLRPILNPFIEMESIKFRSLEEFFQISADSDRNFEYTVAWLDCVSSGSAFGRGIFMRGNHSRSENDKTRKIPGRQKLVVPLDFPAWALNRLSVKAFNTLYYGKQVAREKKSSVYYDPFFYPLDAVLQWNRIYGKNGLVQFQCVVPVQGGHQAIREILATIVASGQASFLAVLKEFGAISSPGILSFPRPGVTLCLDFAMRGERTLALLQRLDQMVAQAGGAMYPAKDALMRAENFKSYYPRWAEFAEYVDSQISSSFWRRVSR
ncbi:MAG: FAD-binding oxidoreductase [Oligoflexia bacterium]|nr:FAD-binding oxidoreductase [Oligoflexia bacterium]